jgi:hypothetical protein
MGKRGTVFGDRYHGHVLRTPTETRRAVAYVRNNHRKHMAQVGQVFSPRYVDRFSSEARELELPRPRGWLLRVHGPPQ